MLNSRDRGRLSRKNVRRQRVSRSKALPYGRFRPQAERLEDRLLLAMVNWSNGIGPGAADDAVIDAAGISVTHTTGIHTVQSLMINDPMTLSGSTLIVTGDQSLEGDGEIRFREAFSAFYPSGQIVFGPGLTIHFSAADFSNLGSASFTNAIGGASVAEDGALI